MNSKKTVVYDAVARLAIMRSAVRGVRNQCWGDKKTFDIAERLESIIEMDHDLFMKHLDSLLP